MSFDLQQFLQTRYTQRASSLNGWTASARDIIAAYQCGERDFAHVRVQPSQEPEGDFFEAQIIGADFRHAKLMMVNFAGADLSQSDFRAAHLQAVNLSGANISLCRMDDCYLAEANLECASAVAVSLDSADLRKTNLRHAYLMRANLSGANLSATDFYGAAIMGATFTHTTLYGLLKSKTERPNFTDAIGFYAAFAPGLSSRTDSLYGSVDKHGRLLLHAGCWIGHPSGLVERLNEKLPSHQQAHRDRYLAAIQFIETMYQADVQAGIWTVSE